MKVKLNGMLGMRGRKKIKLNGVQEGNPSRNGAARSELSELKMSIIRGSIKSCPHLRDVERICPF